MECDPPDPDPPPDPAPSSSAPKRRLEAEVEPPAKKTITSPELASASIQTVYTDSSLVIGGLSYTSLDKGPYVVHVSRIEPDLAPGTILKPIKFGQFLKTHKIANICVDGVKKVGRNKVSVEFKSADAANNFISLPILSMCKYSATIPMYNITRMGLIRQVPTDMSMTEFVESLDLPKGCGKVLKARRLNRKTIENDQASWVPTQTVVVTFQGQVLPTRVFSCYYSLPVELYQYPTIQCHACCRFGHTKLQCRSKPKCFRCAKDHLGDTCEIPEKESTCFYCSGRHFTTSKDCPEIERQRSIKFIMAQESVSYEEASAQVPQVNRSYAEVAQESISLPSSQTPAPASHSQPQHRRSYAKTVYASPRPKPTYGKSYDKIAHQQIVAEPKSVMGNGCALTNSKNLELSSSQQKDNMLETILTLLINIILMNPQPLPSNVAPKLSQLVSLFQNQYGSADHTAVEHPERATKEA